MCHLIGHAIQHALTRRNLLVGGNALAACGISALTCSPVTAEEATQQKQILAQAATEASQSNTRLLLLGTAGGPTWWPNTTRCSISSAIAVGDALYLVDCGDGVGRRLQEALGRANPRPPLTTLRAIFLTHLHSDHTVDYPNILL